jgi:hypothetical protein
MAEPVIPVDANISPLRRKMREAADSVRGFASSAEDSFGRITSPLEALQQRFIAIGAILAGGAIFKATVTAASQLAEESIQLGRSMDVSATEASGWLAVLEDVGASSDELGGATRRLTKNIQENEAGLNRLGLATRDSNGNIRSMSDIMMDAIALTNQFKDGQDRNAVAQALFGKSVDGSSKLLNINADALRENMEWARQVGAEVGQNNVDAFRRYDAAMDRAGIAATGLKNTVGTALMPVLAKLAEWFNTVAPGAITVVRGAVGGLLSVFWALKNGVTVLWETINAMVVTVAEPIRALAVSLYQLVTGDFRGAWETIKGVPSVIGKAWSDGWAEMLASSQEARDQIYALFAEDAPTAKPPGGDRTAPSDLMDKEPKDKPQRESLMAYYEERLAQAKLLAAQEDALRGMSREAERDFWLQALEDKRLNDAERLQISRRVAGLEVEILKENAQARKQIEDAYEKARAGVAAEHRRAKLQADLNAVEQQEELLRAQYEADEITKTQLIQAEITFAQQRHAIRTAAMQEAIDAETDVVKQAHMRTELEEMQHQQRILEIRKGVELGKAENGAFFDDIAQGFGGALDGMLLRAQTFQQALGGLWQSASQAFVKHLITDPLVQWIASKAKMLAVSLGFITAETSAKTAGATTGAAVTAAGATAEVASKGTSAAAGAANAVAGIPIIGPILAVAAFAAMLAMIMGSKRNIKSAAGGYDIPRGLNPLVQAHEEEMILPAKFANVIRGMAGQQGGAEQAAPELPPVALSITAMDGRDVRRVLLDNPAALREALGAAMRDIGVSGGIR